MDTKHRKAVILNDLPPLHISYLKDSVGLKWVGKRGKAINLYSTNPLTGKKEVTGSFYVEVDIDTNGYDYAHIHYSANGKEHQQRIELITKKSNLNKGNVFYFKCPVTGEVRRKLFLYDGRFVSRKAIVGSYYQSELQSHKQRKAAKQLNQVTTLQRKLMEAHKKRHQKYYAGEPTKRYVKALMASDDLMAW